MKSFRMAALIFFALFVTTITASTVYAGFYEKESPPKISGILHDQLSQRESDELMIESHYQSPLTIDEVKDRPILKIFNEIYWDGVGQPFDEYLNSARESENEAGSFVRDFVVFGDNLFRITLWEYDGQIRIAKRYDYDDSSIPTYLRDLLQADDTVTISGNTVKVKNIFCFDSLNSHTGAVVYLITDIGVYVKYYEQSTSEAVCYSEEDFRKIMSEYYQFLTSHENNYNENGEPLGGTPSLTDYLRERSSGQLGYHDKETIITWGVLSVLAIGIIGVVIGKKRIKI